MTVHPLHNLALNDLNHKLVACKIHKPSNNITVWVAFQRFHLTIILRPPNGRRAATPRWAISCYEANYSRLGFL